MKTSRRVKLEITYVVDLEVADGIEDSDIPMYLQVKSNDEYYVYIESVDEVDKNWIT